MTKERFKIIPACYLILIKNGQTLLLRRYNTGYEDGSYSLVAGHLDGQETFRQAMAREAKEEAGIILNPDVLKVVHVMHRLSIPDEPQLRERIDVFMTANEWAGEPLNLEPDKCDDLRWFNSDNLPENIIPYIKQGLKCAQDGIFYSEFGF
ncbi:MAG: NUDIX domain-containing protein [Parcubacteria group bacterium]|nr:NUDIX domain-containing protein [Parcubacteria group bacterium]